ncbi:hypothetical protein RSC2_04058 [Bacillus paralicheniformis]|nr:hypothetical protein RSC2_04058 [Bacillus paralicheniformis]
MIKFLGRRLVYMLISLWVIVTATFFLMRAIPGGPFSGERKLPLQLKPVSIPTMV